MTKNTLFTDFLKFVSLNVLGMIGLSLYILADTFFVAKGLGTFGIASLNLAIAIYSFIHASGLMIGIGGASKYAIFKAQENPKANVYFSHSFLMGILIGSLFLCVGFFFSEPLSFLLGADVNTLEMTNIYLKTILCFAPFFIINNILIAFIRNDGAPKLAMSGMLIGSFSNIILDYVFIFPFGMGMFGAAFATGLAPIISILVLSLHFIKKQNSFHLYRCAIKIKTILTILSLGVSSFITEFSSGIILIIFNVVILSIAGNIGVAAYGIVANLSLVAVSIFVGIAQGIQPLVSRSYGYNRKDELTSLLTYALILALLLAIILNVVINLLREPIIAIFNSEGNLTLASYADTGLMIYFIGFLFAGANIVIISFLSASRSPKNAFIISILRGFVLIIPLVLILPSAFGILGVWLVFPFVEFITLIITITLFIKEHKDENVVI